MQNGIRTSRKVATAASRALRSVALGKKTKSAIASALVNRKRSS